MPKVFTSKTQRIGETGENIASMFLVKHGFMVIERNYTKKWGEIDLVVSKEGKLYFIEVKSVTRETLPDLIDLNKDQYRPEDNMHPWKLKRLSRTIQTYLISKKIGDEVEWQVDLLVVFIDTQNRKARVKVVKDIIL